MRKGYISNVHCRLRLATQGGRDPRRILLEGFRHVDEVDRRLAAHVAITDEVAEQPGMIRRHRLDRAEAEEATRPRNPVAAGEFAREAPAALGQDLVVRRDP